MNIGDKVLIVKSPHGDAVNKVGILEEINPQGETGYAVQIEGMFYRANNRRPEKGTTIVFAEEINPA